MTTPEQPVLSKRAEAELARIREPVRQEEAGEIELSALLASERSDPEFEALVQQRVRESAAADEGYAWTLKELRNAFGRTQAELAGHIGSTQSYLSQLERGSGDMLVSTLLAYLDGVGIAPRLLVRLDPTGQTIEIALGDLVAHRRREIGIAKPVNERSDAHQGHLKLVLRLHSSMPSNDRALLSDWRSLAALDASHR